MKTKALTIIISLVFSFSLGFAPSVIAKETTKETKAKAEYEKTYSLPLRDIQRFATAVAQIKRYYIEPIDDKTLFNHAISGMLTNLDPHSSFLDPESLKDLQSSTSGEFGGVGIEVIPEAGFIKVISPIDDTPAYKAGIKSGDLIIRVGNKYVKNLTLREAINLIRGKKGTKVILTVLRKGEKKPLKFTLTRDVIKIQTVKSKLYDKYYGYLRVAFFQSSTKRDLNKNIKELQKETKGKLKGVILDLRNNPGGLLNSSIKIADTFLDLKKLNQHKSLIVYTKGRIESANIEAKATKGDSLKGLPIVVLINEGSASAAEIVAGALQDHHRAIIVGTKSFGKGSVQTVLPIDYESGIKLTTALYYTPSGNSIQATGIEPDVIIADLKIPKSKTQDVIIDPINEADLDGHLENGNDKKDKTAAKEKNVDKDRANKADIELARTDYQLYAAINILKGLTAIQK